MIKIEISRVSKYLLKAKTIGINSGSSCKQLLVTKIIPQSKKYTVLGVKVCSEKLLPNFHKGSKIVGHEILKIHKKQNWAKRFTMTMFDNSAGLSMAMISARLVEEVVEVGEFSNLWGLLATHPVVSETTYEVLSFIVEFFVALLAFTLTEYYRDEYRESKNTSLELKD